MTFSYPILSKLIQAEEQRQENQRNEDTVAFLKSSNLLNRFDRFMDQDQIERVKADYDTYGKVDDDILFAYHTLTASNKRAFLSILTGLIADSTNVQQFNENMASAVEFTLDHLEAEKNS